MTTARTATAIGAAIAIVAIGAAAFAMPGNARWDGRGPGTRMQGQHHAQAMMGQGRMNQGQMGQGQMGQGRMGQMGQGQMGQGMAMRLQGIDTNNDGKLQGGELMAWRESVFDAMDADGDDTLTKAEFMAVRLGPGADPDRAGMRADQMQAMKAAEFDAMDTDRNGRIDRDQFVDAAAAAFTTADTDRDGALSAAEFPRMHRR